MKIDYERLFRHTMREIALVSDAPASAPASTPVPSQGQRAPRTRKPSTESKKPPPATIGPIERLVGMWGQAGEDEMAQRRVCVAAQEELRRAKHSGWTRVEFKDRDTEEGRLAIGRDTRSAQVVADAYGYSVNHIYKLRRAAANADQESEAA